MGFYSPSGSVLQICVAKVVQLLKLIGISWTKRMLHLHHKESDEHTERVHCKCMKTCATGE